MGWVATFEQLIAADWKLPKNGGFLQITEPNAPHALFEITGGRLLAFSLDRPGVAGGCFPFFSNTAPEGMRQVTDAIVVAEVAGQPYVIAVEMKTKEADKSKALRQVESGRCLVAWIDQLLRLHGHGATPYQFCGIVSLKPRRQERKGTSRRSAELPAPESSPHGEGYPVFVLKNHPRVSVTDLAKKLLPKP